MPAAAVELRAARRRAVGGRFPAGGTTPIDRLRSVLRDVRDRGDGFDAPCPVAGCAYRLSIDPGTDGRALVCCPAGCDVRAITAALGLSVRDLFPAPRRGGGGRQ